MLMLMLMLMLIVIVIVKAELEGIVRHLEQLCYEFESPSGLAERDDALARGGSWTHEEGVEEMKESEPEPQREPEQPQPVPEQVNDAVLDEMMIVLKPFVRVLWQAASELDRKSTRLNSSH